jgi:hypothetical protein
MRQLTWMEPVYETARAWAVQPVSHPPVGWAQIVRRGIASLSAQEAPPPIAVLKPALVSAHRHGSELLIIVAAMLAEVCPC